VNARVGPARDDAGSFLLTDGALLRRHVRLARSRILGASLDLPSSARLSPKELFFQLRLIWKKTWEEISSY
jgi:hypothetical protein